MVARPVRSFLASPSVGAGLLSETANPSPSNASRSFLEFALVLEYPGVVLDPREGGLGAGVGLAEGGEETLAGLRIFPSHWDLEKSSPNPLDGAAVFVDDGEMPHASFFVVPVLDDEAVFTADFHAFSSSAAKSSFDHWSFEALDMVGSESCDGRVGRPRRMGAIASSTLSRACTPAFFAGDTDILAFIAT